MKIIAVIQARIASTRLPEKVLMNLSGHPLLYHVVERARHSKRVDNVIISIPNSIQNQKISSFAKNYNIPVFTGDENNVLDRFVNTAKQFEPDLIVRLTGDNPLVDPTIIDSIIELHINHKADYTSNAVKRTNPRGLDVEVIQFKTLEKINGMSLEPQHKEHVAPFLYENPDLFHLQHFIAKGILRRPDLRFTVDTVQDWELMSEIYRRFYIPGKIIEVKDVIRWIDNNPRWLGINNQSEEDQVSSNANQGIRQSKIS